MDNSHKRLCDPCSEAADAQKLTDSVILKVQTWPQEPDVRYGEKEISRLCHRFNLDTQEQYAVDGMRDFVEDNSGIPGALKRICG